MQTGNLKSCRPSKKKAKYWWLKWLNPLSYLPHRLYDDFLDAFFGYNKGVQTYYYYHTYPETFDLPLFSAVKIKELDPLKVLTKELQIKDSRKISFSLDFARTKVDIKSGLDLSYKVKWILLNFKRILQLKTANIHLWKRPRTRSFMNLDLKSRLTKKIIPNDVFELPKFADSKGVLVEMKPYTNSLSLDELYSIPLEKNPMNKNFISLALLDKFKQSLAASAQVKPTEVKLITAYENMHIEMYKDIKHNAQKNILMCYLDETKSHIKKPKNFYLVFGQRLFDQKMITIVCER